MAATAPLFSMSGVSKRYGGVRALEQADLAVTPGRIHAILGENGAGKSTLIKVMAGVVTPDEGVMTLGRTTRSTFTSPAAANQAGIVCIFQELSLDPRPLGRGQYRHQFAADVAGPHRPSAATRDCRGGAGASGRGGRSSRPRSSRTCRCRGGKWSRSPRRWRESPRILILDEATSALTAADVAKVFVVLKRLARRRGSRCFTYPIACTRSQNSPTNVRCSATAARLRPMRRGRRATTKSSN